MVKIMTAEEIKQRYSMRDVSAKYGLIPNRAGFIQCPFHKGDREASCKLYEKDFHCFGCGANGDIFTFIQMIENCDFKTAFYSLGGEYDHKKTFKSRLSLYRIEKAKEQKKKEHEKERIESELNLALIDAYRMILEKYPPFSEAWCDSINNLQFQLYKHGELHGIPY